MENEEIDLTEIIRYNGEVVILVQDWGLSNKKWTIVQQPKRKYFKQALHIPTGIDYAIDTCDVMEIRKNIIYLKGSSDYSQLEVTKICDKDVSDNWENIISLYFNDIITIVHSKEELESMLLKPDEPVELKEMKLDLTATDEDINKMIDLVDLDTFCKIIQSRLKYENEGDYCNSRDNDRPTMKDIGTINKKWAKNYLREWARSKFRFYKLFGDKLTIEKEISKVRLPNEMREHITSLKSMFPLYTPIFNCINERCFVEDKITKGDLGMALVGAYKEGMTLTKFFSQYNCPDLDKELSKIYQADGTSKIYISINPIDYLTVSINNSGWKSCHNFFDGCYSTAGLSYMLDTTSLVSFSSNRNTKYHFYRDFEWNSKCWREMVYVSKENSAMAFSRQYPFTEERFSKEVRNLMEELFSNYFEVENKYKIVDNSKYLSVGTANSNLLYNDIANGYSYKSVINKFDKNKAQVKIEIGNDVKSIGTNEWLDDGDGLIW